MGDRTTCRVTISKRDYEYLSKLTGQNWGIGGDALQEFVGTEEFEDDGDTVTFWDHQANYGMWDDLTDILDAENIEYDHWWGDGGDYKEGNRHKRLVDGVLQEIEIYCTQETEAEFVKALKLLIDEGKDDEVKSKILKAYEEFYPFEITPLGKQNSIEFMKEIKG